MVAEKRKKSKSKLFNCTPSTKHNKKTADHRTDIAPQNNQQRAIHRLIKREIISSTVAPLIIALNNMSEQRRAKPGALC